MIQEPKERYEFLEASLQDVEVGDEILLRKKEDGPGDLVEYSGHSGLVVSVGEDKFGLWTFVCGKDFTVVQVPFREISSIAVQCHVLATRGEKTKRLDVVERVNQYHPA